MPDGACPACHGLAHPAFLAAFLGIKDRGPGGVLGDLCRFLIIDTDGQHGDLKEHPATRTFCDSVPFAPG